MFGGKLKTSVIATSCVWSLSSLTNSTELIPLNPAKMKGTVTVMKDETWEFFFFFFFRSKDNQIPHTVNTCFWYLKECNSWTWSQTDWRFSFHSGENGIMFRHESSFPGSDLYEDQPDFVWVTWSLLFHQLFDQPFTQHNFDFTLSPIERFRPVPDWPGSNEVTARHHPQHQGHCGGTVLHLQHSDWSQFKVEKNPNVFWLIDEYLDLILLLIHMSLLK